MQIVHKKAHLEIKKIKLVADPGCLSRIRIIWIPDPNYFYPRSRISSQEFRYFNPKNWFLSTLKYDPICSSQIRIPNPDPDFLPIPDPGVKRAPDPGSGTLLLYTWLEREDAFLVARRERDGDLRQPVHNPNIVDNYERRRGNATHQTGTRPAEQARGWNERVGQGGGRREH